MIISQLFANQFLNCVLISRPLPPKKGQLTSAAHIVCRAFFRFFFKTHTVQSPLSACPCDIYFAPFCRLAMKSRVLCLFPPSFLLFWGCSVVICSCYRIFSLIRPNNCTCCHPQLQPSAPFVSSRFRILSHCRAKAHHNPAPSTLSYPRLSSLYLPCRGNPLS